MFSKNNDRSDCGQAKSSGGVATAHAGFESRLQRRCFRLPRREIGVLRFLLEGYDGLGFVRTLDAGEGVVEIAWPADRQAEMESVLESLCRELGMAAVREQAS